MLKTQSKKKSIFRKGSLFVQTLKSLFCTIEIIGSDLFDFKNKKETLKHFVKVTCLSQNLNHFKFVLFCVNKTLLYILWHLSDLLRLSWQNNPHYHIKCPYFCQKYWQKRNLKYFRLLAYSNIEVTRVLFCFCIIAVIRLDILRFSRY